MATAVLMPNDDGIESRKDNDSLGGVCLSGETSHIQGKVLRGAGAGTLASIPVLILCNIGTVVHVKLGAVMSSCQKE